VGKLARLFSDEQAKFIEENVNGRSDSELLDLINERFHLEITKTQLKNYKNNHKLNSGLGGPFKKGHIPANKGKCVGIVPKTTFKIGHASYNCDPIGTEKLRSDGYIWVKVSNSGKMWNRWKRKHRIIWESKNGPIPEGKKILFVDGNSLNLSLKNMALVTQSEMARLNQGGYIYPDADMTKTMLNVVKIRNKIWQINK